MVRNHQKHRRLPHPIGRAGLFGQVGPARQAGLPGTRATAAIPARAAAAFILAALLILTATTSVQAAEDRGLTLQGIEIHGNHRTDDEIILRQLGLRPGQAVDGPALLAAIEHLRRRELFAEVDFHTRPGDRRGTVVLVLEVRERGPDLRLGTGLTDLDGWYLIPVEISLNNALGRAEEAAIQWRLGYRHAGLIAHFRDVAAPRDPWHWAVDLALVSTDRIYFQEGIEYAHRVKRHSLGLALGRRLGASWDLTAGVRLESAQADSTGRIWMDDRIAGFSRGDRVAFQDLPAGIADGAGRRSRSALRCDLVLDTRSGQRTGTAARGTWGRLRLQQTLENASGGFTAATLDVRHYHGMPGGVLAGRALGAMTGRPAPFYDRLYLGGLYSVRGVPSQSLSPPEGGTWMWLYSLEYRAALVGRLEDPRLAGSLFLDIGQGGGPDDDLALKEARTSLGWGLRWRLLPGIRLGIDAAAPLDGSPVNQAFRVHGVLGWSF